MYTYIFDENIQYKIGVISISLFRHNIGIRYTYLINLKLNVTIKT